MGRGPLKASDLFDGFFTKHGESKSVCNVREFLLISPINLVLVTTIVIIMSCSRPVVHILLMVDFLGLREPLAGWLSPSVVELEELIVQMQVDIFLSMSMLVKTGRDV